jgi:hypothetical protein
LDVALRVHASRELTDTASLRKTGTIQRHSQRPKGQRGAAPFVPNQKTPVYVFPRAQLIDTTARPRAPQPRHRNRSLKVQHLRLGAQPEPQEGLRRQQRDVMASGAIDLHEVALAEILDPRGVEGKLSRVRCSWYVPGKRADATASMVECHDRVFLKRASRLCTPSAMAGVKRRRRTASPLRQSLRRPSSMWAPSGTQQSHATAGSAPFRTLPD